MDQFANNLIRVPWQGNVATDERGLSAESLTAVVKMFSPPLLSCELHLSLPGLLPALDAASSHNHSIRASGLESRTAFCNFNICYEAALVLRNHLVTQGFEVELRRTEELDYCWGFPAEDHYFLTASASNGETFLVDGAYIQMLRSMMRDSFLPEQDILIVNLCDFHGFVSAFADSICGADDSVKLKLEVPAGFAASFFTMQFSREELVGFFNRLWSGVAVPNSPV